MGYGVDLVWESLTVRLVVLESIWSNLEKPVCMKAEDTLRLCFEEQWQSWGWEVCISGTSKKSLQLYLCQNSYCNRAS